MSDIHSAADRLRIEDAYPLGHAQAGMIFHNQLHADSSIYHDIVAFQLRLRFDFCVLTTILDDLVAAHPILRTRFRLKNASRPLQVVMSGGRMAVTHRDLTRFSEAAQDAYREEWLNCEKRNAFDLESATPMRVHAHVLGAERWELVFSFHHALLDGWSLGLLLSAVIDSYNARLQGSEATPRIPACRYRDYIKLEQEVLQQPAATEYWRVALEGSMPSVPPRSAETGHIGVERRALPLEGSRSAAMRTLAKRLRVSVKHVLLALHLKALGVICGQDQVVSGVVTNGRPEQDGGDAVLGLFLNSVPLTLRTRGLSWDALIVATFAQEQALWPHRRLPLSEIMRLQGGRTLFETLFNYTHFHNYGGLVGGEGGVILERSGFEHSNYPLVVQAGQEADGSAIYFYVEADRAVFSPAQIERMVSIYSEVLDRMLADPTACSDAEDFVPERDRQQL
ncbi:condensation domain-containing protein, partial [Xanthomonas melonis]|uniref:condensation domain-containing protein n=1 Tax=Xanthomonas melonis TaxID=56456 RepID=UPI003EBD4327